MDQPSRKQCVGVFLGVVGLTAVEIAVAHLAAVSNALLMVAVGTLVVTKAALVAMVFVHLRSERPVLRARVLVPMSMPALLVLALVARAVWNGAP